MTCPLCDAARANPVVGRIDRSCPGCLIRWASNLPRTQREEQEQAIRDDRGDDAADQFKADVLAEFNRRQTWKRAQATFDG